MDMKRLEISRLMDEYVDGEFFPEGGSSTDVEAVKARVLANAAPSGKRRMPPLKAALLAAALALAACLTLAVATQLPQRIYGLLVGGTAVEEQWVDEYGIHHSAFHITDLDFKDPVVLSGGRLWLTVDGECTDITDFIDADTPYIITRTSSEHGNTVHLVVGGTPDSFGYVQLLEVNAEGGYVPLQSSNYYTAWLFSDGHGISEDSFTDEDWGLFNQLNRDDFRAFELKLKKGPLTQEERQELDRLDSGLGEAIVAYQYSGWFVSARAQLYGQTIPWALCGGASDHQRHRFHGLLQEGGDITVEDMEAISLDP